MTKPALTAISEIQAMSPFAGGKLLHVFAFHQIFLSNAFHHSSQYQLLWLHLLSMIHTD